MTKQEFLDALREKLSELPREDVEERLNFYSEMIDDRVEDGLSEEEAIAQIGTVNEVASQIISEIPLTRIFKDKIKKKRKLRGWEIVLLILGSPIWFSLLIAAFSVALSLYAVLWSIVITLWASFVTLIVGGVVLIAPGVILIVKGAVFAGIAIFGMAIATLGLSIFFFFSCKYATIGCALIAKKLFLCIKKGFVGKENAR